MSKPDGALASDALCTQCLSNAITLDYISSLSKKQWLILSTSFVYLLVGLLVPLSSEVLFLDTHYGCGSETCWPPRLSANKRILRLLQGLLSFIALMTIVVMVMLSRSPTGLYLNPSSIASVVALLHHPEVLEDFRTMDDSLSSKELKTRLGNKRYQMGVYRRRDGSNKYGIIPAAHNYTPGWSQIALNSGDQSTGIHRHRSQRISTTTDIAFGILIIGVLSVTVAYFKGGSKSSFNRFSSSNTFGPRFFMASLGSLIALYWKGIERKVQSLTPFRRLISSLSSAKPSILFKQHSFPPLAIFNSLINDHLFAALVALTTFLADILTITLAVVPFSHTEIFLEFLVCFYTSMAILSLMMLVILGLLFWKHKLRHMPRDPDTLAGVISYICDGYFLADFGGCDGIDGKELEGRIERNGRTYEFGRFVGISGRKRWGIEWEGETALEFVSRRLGGVVV